MPNAIDAFRLALHFRRGGIWLQKAPLFANRKVCVLASFTAGGFISDHTRHLAAEWRRVGYTVVLVVASNRRIGMDACPPETIADGVITRRNTGYDFGSWAAVIRDRPDILEAAQLALANDSVYGPLTGFQDMIERVDDTRADVVGTVESYEVRRHFQSFLLFYKPVALKSPAFKRFWQERSGGGREAVVQQAEVPLMEKMQAGQLTTEALYRADPGKVINPTLRSWRALIDAGFPFVKVQLLRENPWHADIQDWDRVLADHGFDPERVRQHLGSRYGESAACQAASPIFKAAQTDTRSPWNAAQRDADDASTGTRSV